MSSQKVERKQVIEAVSALAQELGVALPFKTKTHGSLAEWNAELEKLKAIKTERFKEPTIDEPTIDEPTIMPDLMMDDEREDDRDDERDFGRWNDEPEDDNNGYESDPDNEFNDDEPEGEEPQDDALTIEHTPIKKPFVEVTTIVSCDDSDVKELTMDDLPKPSVTVIPFNQIPSKQMIPRHNAVNRLRNTNDNKKLQQNPHDNGCVYDYILYDKDGRPCEHVILRDEKEKCFWLFRSYALMRADWLYKKQIKHLHETLLPNRSRRVFFDIDRDDKPFTMKEIGQMEKVFTEALEVIYKIKLPNNVFAVYLSQKRNCEILDDADHDTIFYKESCMQNEEAPKGSVHLIARHLHVYDHIEHEELYRLVYQYIQPMMTIYPWIKYWDRGTCKSTQNLRCPMSYKCNSLRQKLCISDKNLELNIGEILPDDKLLPRLLDDAKREYNKQRKEAQKTDIIEGGLSLESVMNNEELKVIIGNDYQYLEHNHEYVKFKRVNKVECMFCKRVHDKDDWLSARVSTQGIYVSCMRTDKGNDGKKRASKWIKTFSKKEKRVLSDVYTDNLFNDTLADSNYNIRLYDIGLDRKAFTDEYIQTFDDCRALYVKAPMKMGKTQQLIKHIKVVKPKYIIWISFRITYTLDMVKECRKVGNDIHLANYMDIEGPICLQNEGHNHLIIQYDSLNRLMALGDIKGEDIMVIMDESEAIIQQMNQITSTTALYNYEKFDQVISYSKRLICMDANLGERTHTVVKNILQPTDKIILHEYKHKNMSNHTAHITCNEGRFVNNIIKYAKNKGRAAIMTNSRRYADKLYIELLKHVDKSKLMLYAGNDSSDSDHIDGLSKEAEKKQHLKGDINEAIVNFDIVIFTTTVTAGVSITAKHFSRVYGYFINKTADTLQCSQLLGRVRDIENHEIFLCFRASRATLPTKEETIFNLIDERRAAYLYDFQTMDKAYNRNDHRYQTDRKSLRNRITVLNMIEKHKSANYFGYYLLQILRRAGIRITRMFKKPDEINRKEFNDDLRSMSEAEFENRVTQADQMSKAIVLNNVIDDIKSGNNTRSDVKSVMHAYKKAELMVNYNISEAEMDLIQNGVIKQLPDMVEKTVAGEILAPLQSKSQHAIYKNLVDFYSGDKNTADNIKTIQDLKGSIHNGSVDRIAKANIAKWMLQSLSFEHIHDDKSLTHAQLNDHINQFMDTLKKNPDIVRAISAYRDKKVLINVKDAVFKHNLCMINGFLQTSFGIMIKKRDRNADEYIIKNTSNFYYDIEKRAVRLIGLQILEQYKATVDAHKHVEELDLLIKTDMNEAAN